MNVYIVTQRDLSSHPIIVGVFRHMDAAMECKQAGAEVGFDRFIDVCGAQSQYNPNEDYFVINEKEEELV